MFYDLSIACACLRWFAIAFCSPEASGEYSVLWYKNYWIQFSIILNSIQYFIEKVLRKYWDTIQYFLSTFSVKYGESIELQFEMILNSYIFWGRNHEIPYGKCKVHLEWHIETRHIYMVYCVPMAIVDVPHEREPTHTYVSYVYHMNTNP